MSGLRAWTRPTLVRRIIVALLLASAVVWIVMLVMLGARIMDSGQRDDNLLRLGATIQASLARAGSEAEARAVVDTAAAMLRNSYRANDMAGHALWQLTDRQGRALPLALDAVTQVLDGRPGRLTSMTIAGQDYRIYQGDTANWSVRLAQPEYSTWWVVQLLAGDLMVDVAIAFPLFLFPVWFAVMRGLRPLRQLSARIARRDGDDLSPLGIDTHYTELKPLATALDRLLEQLSEKLRRERAFVQDAAHELRTPMAVIAAQAHALAGAADAQHKLEAERGLAHAVGRASHLVRKLLELALVDSGRAQQKQMLDIAELVRSELVAMSSSALARGIELSLEAPDTLMYALEHHTFLSILQNLLSNALRYVPQGGQVCVELAGSGGGFTLSVADDGPGIPADERKLVFERFYRGSGHVVAGAGLGLAIASQAVARLGGHITLDDGIGGKGCSFLVRVQ